MANLEMLFQKAETAFGLQREKPKKGTMETLKFNGRGVAWRWLRKDKIALCPPTPRRKISRKDEFLVIKDKKSECRYKDPDGMLKPNVWNYTGCDCTNIPEEQVFEWIETAYKFQRG